MANVTPGQFLFAFAVAAAAGTAVFFHADRNKVPHPSAWASFVFLFLIVGLPILVALGILAMVGLWIARRLGGGRPNSVLPPPPPGEPVASEG